MEKLYWLNRHYIKHSQPKRIHDLARPFFGTKGLLPANLEASVENWFAGVFVPDDGCFALVGNAKSCDIRSRGPCPLHRLSTDRKLT